MKEKERTEIDIAEIEQQNKIEVHTMETKSKRKIRMMKEEIIMKTMRKKSHQL